LRGGGWFARSALRNGAEAKQAAGNALKASNGKDVQFLAALSLAMVGDRKKPLSLQIH
jgi:hypothetical protein